VCVGGRSELQKERENKHSKKNQNKNPRYRCHGHRKRETVKFWNSTVKMIGAEERGKAHKRMARVRCCDTEAFHLFPCLSHIPL